MSAHESMEQAESTEHISSENKKIALLIAVIALCLALSETLGKGAQTETISKNVEASNLWAFFQAKTIRRTVVQTAAEQAKLGLGAASDDAARAAAQKQIDDWQKTAARYRSEPETGEGTTELMCHPGYADEALKNSSTRLQESRQTELEILTDSRIRKLVATRGIRLISYQWMGEMA